MREWRGAQDALAAADLQRTKKSAVMKKARPGLSRGSRKIFDGNLKFIRQPLDNVCTASSETSAEIFSTRRRYPQKRWKTSG
jgi:hypothetical protein